MAGRIDYDAFGRITAETNPGLLPFGFAGGLHDRDTGLVRFGGRDYEPRTGRFTTKDPILFNGRGTNLYAYGGGDPVNNWDLDGAAFDSVSATCGRRPALCAVAFGGGSTVGAPVATAPVAGGVGVGVCSISTAEIGALGAVGVVGIGLSIGNRAPAVPVCRAPPIPFEPPPLVGPQGICNLERRLDNRCQYHCPQTGNKYTITVLPGMPCPPTILVK